MQDGAGGQVAGEHAARHLLQFPGRDAGAGAQQRDVFRPQRLAARRARASATLRRTSARIGSSEAVGFFSGAPSASSTSRIWRTSAARSSSDSEALWSGPGMSRSRVKCFSITVAPSATAAVETASPSVWSE